MAKDKYGNIVKLQKALSKVWDLKVKPIQTEQDLETLKKLDDPKQKVGFMDCASVCMIRFEKKDMAVWFMNNFDVTSTKLPALDYEAQGTASRCNHGEVKLSTEYTKRIVDIFESWSDGIHINSSKDYPVTFYNDDFEVILAPRVDD